jgi:hypothetical protein
MEEIFGFSLQTLAESMAKHNELRTQYGEAQGRQAFARYLAERGQSEDSWARAWNAWNERFRADPTGMLQAQFHQIEGQLATKAHFGDVRDMSQDNVAGVTLDLYAKLCVELGKPGVDAEALVRQYGLPDMATWQAASAGWTAKMAADTTFALSTQYGALYQKHAGPAFAQQQLAQTAAILADANKPQEVAPAKEADLTQPTLLAQLKSSNQAERWSAARWLAHQWRKGDPSTQANLACIPVLIEILERHDEHTVSNAEDAVGKLTSDLEQYTEDVRSALTRCLNRAQEKLASLQAAFAPIQNKAVPERVGLQTRIQDYTSLVGTIQGVLSDWRAPAPVAAVAGLVAAGASPSMPRPSRGFPMAVLLVIPVVLGVVGFFGWRAMSHHSPAAASSAAAPATPPPGDPASTAAPTATPPAPKPAAPPATPPAKPTPPKPKGKH